MTASFDSLEAIDDALADEGVPPMSPFWRETLREFYEHPTARTLVLRVGRRGGKGLTMTKVAINEAVFGDFTIPPGEVHRFAFVSVSKDEASERLRTIADYLRKLGVTFHAKGDEIFLTDRPIAFRVCAATIAATSGFTCIGASLDEGAKWGDDDAADPGDEVLASTVAMMATHRRARLLIPSSPWGVDDWHARRFDVGDNATQLTAYAPSWVANPVTITEESSKENLTALQWERECLAIPGDTADSAFAVDDVLDAFSRPIAPAGSDRWIVIDAAKLQSTGGDDFAIAVAAPAQAGGVCMLEVTGVSAGGTMLDAVEKIASLAKKHGAVRVFGDQFESGGLRALLQQRGLILDTPPWTVRSKHDAGALLGRLFREGLIALPNHQRMKHELITLDARLRQNGQVEYPTNGKDYAALCFALCHAIGAGLIPADALTLHATPTAEQLDAATETLTSIGEPSDTSAIERIARHVDGQEREHLAAIEEALDAARQARLARHLPPVEPVEADFVNDPKGAAEVMRGFAAANQAAQRALSKKK